MLEDKRLIWQFKRGSRKALERIYEKYETYLITIAVAFMNNVHTAEDVLHDVFVKLVQSSESIRMTGSLRGYLATCVANTARNKLKRRAIEPAGLEDADVFVSEAAGPETLTMRKEEAIRLNKALSQIPFEQKEVVILHVHGGMTLVQIARELDLSVNTVRSRYRYGLEKLKSLLESEVTDEIAS